MSKIQTRKERRLEALRLADREERREFERKFANEIREDEDLLLWEAETAHYASSWPDEVTLDRMAKQCANMPKTCLACWRTVHDERRGCRYCREQGRLASRYFWPEWECETTSFDPLPELKFEDDDLYGDGDWFESKYEYEAEYEAESELMANLEREHRKFHFDLDRDDEPGPYRVPSRHTGLDSCRCWCCVGLRVICECARRDCVLRHRDAQYHRDAQHDEAPNYVPFPLDLAEAHPEPRVTRITGDDRKYRRRARRGRRGVTLRSYREGRVRLSESKPARPVKASGWRARQGWQGFCPPRIPKRRRRGGLWYLTYRWPRYLPYARKADGLPIPKWALAVEAARCLNGCPLLSGDRCVRGLCFGCYTRKYMARRRHSLGPVFWTSQELAASLQDTAWRTYEKLTSRAIEGLPGSIEALAEYRGWRESLATMYVAKERERRLARSDF